MTERLLDLQRFYGLLDALEQRLGGKRTLAECHGRMDWHRGSGKTGSGNHRGSIFRLIVGSAIKERERWTEPESWGVGADPSAAATRLGRTRSEIVEAEASLERAVSEHLGRMSFLWLSVEDPPGSEIVRAMVERNAIALLSNYERAPLDRSSDGWLGRHSDRERVRRSGLWNNHHVDAQLDSGFLGTLEALINTVPGRGHA